jgi:hypothetical protein
MKLPLTKIATLLMTTLILISTIQLINAQDHTLAYQLLNKPGGNSIYELNVVVPQHLHDYYTDKSHRLTSRSVFSKFVTPYTLKPVADKLWEIYDNEEDFANGVLMIVHQIEYVETIPQKYPVETMVEQQGDCDLFSFIAASIIKARRNGCGTSVLRSAKSHEHRRASFQCSKRLQGQRLLHDV